MVTKEERQEIFSDVDCTLRKTEAHAVQVATVAHLQSPFVY